MNEDERSEEREWRAKKSHSFCIMKRLEIVHKRPWDCGGCWMLWALDNGLPQKQSNALVSGVNTDSAIWLMVLANMWESSMEYIAYKIMQFH